jgi:hypothetical protein
MDLPAAHRRIVQCSLGLTPHICVERTDDLKLTAQRTHATRAVLVRGAPPFSASAAAHGLRQITRVEQSRSGPRRTSATAGLIDGHK